MAGNPVGDFFKRVGRSISHLGQKPSPTPTPHKKHKTGKSKDAPEATPTPAPLPSITPTPTPTPAMEIRPAAVVPPDRHRPRDLPYGVAVPNQPGIVTSPYAPTQGYVDVRGIPSSTEVLDPFTGKVFLTP
jgi:hypothetical protein